MTITTFILHNDDFFTAEIGIDNVYDGKDDDMMLLMTKDNGDGLVYVIMLWYLGSDVVMSLIWNFIDSINWYIFWFDAIGFDTPQRARRARLFIWIDSIWFIAILFPVYQLDSIPFNTICLSTVHHSFHFLFQKPLKILQFLIRVSLCVSLTGKCLGKVYFLLIIIQHYWGSEYWLFRFDTQPFDSI